MAAAGRAPAPWCCRRRWRRSRPCPSSPRTSGAYRLIEHAGEAPEGAAPFGRLAAFHGQMGMFVRALAYMMSHGADGIRQASEDAVLNANYVRARLADALSYPFGDRACMHEALFDDRFLKGTHVSTLDFAKALIDEGFHPMTVYFPLVVSGAMLIEPTESGIEGKPRHLHRRGAEPGRGRQSRRHCALRESAALRPEEASRRDPRGARSHPDTKAAPGPRGAWHRQSSGRD